MKALLMLTVFTANLYAVCHCHHAGAQRLRHEMAHADRSIGQSAHCSHCGGQDHPKMPERGAGKSGKANHDGCCGDMVKFTLLDKQIAGKIALVSQLAQILSHPFPAVALRQPATIRPAPALPDEWLYKHSPPDLQALYQSFLI